MVRQGPAKHGVPATSFALIDPSDYFFSSLKTLLMPTEPIRAPVGVNVPGLPMAGFQLTLHGRIWVTPEVRDFTGLSLATAWNGVFVTALGNLHSQTASYAARSVPYFEREQ